MISSIPTDQLVKFVKFLKANPGLTAEEAARQFAASLEKVKALEFEGLSRCEGGPCMFDDCRYPLCMDVETWGDEDEGEV